MSHDQDTADVRRRLGQAAGMLAKSKAQGDAITSGASARYDQVVKRLEELRPKAVMDRDAANEYLELTKEKGALLRTLSRG